MSCDRTVSIHHTVVSCLLSQINGQNHFFPESSVAHPGGGGARGPWSPLLVKLSQKKMAAKCGGLYFMFLGPPLSEVSGSATEAKCV